MRTVTVRSEDASAVSRALLVLRRGGLVAFPTDTVYGVGSLVLQRAAVRRLYEVKGRQAEKAIPILLPGSSVIEQVAMPLNAQTRRLAERFWPGPLTLVVARVPDLPPEVSSGPTVGVRVPDHPVALAILKATGPMAVTSANRSGTSDSRTAEEVRTALGDRVDLLIDGGRTPGGRPSTVVDCTQAVPVILREGPIPAGEILETWAGD